MSSGNTTSRDIVVTYNIPTQLVFFFCALLLEIVNQEQQTKSVSQCFYARFLRLLVSLSVPVLCVLLCFSFSSPLLASASASASAPAPASAQHT